MNSMESAIIIGGGASGLMAALTASERPERTVLLLERQARTGLFTPPGMNLQALS